MGAKYRQMMWSFDHLEFAKEMDAVMVATGLDNTAVSQLSDISASEVSRLRRGLMPNIQMSTYLSLCNAMDIDPRNYWSVHPVDGD